MADDGIQRAVGPGLFKEAVHFLTQRLVALADGEGYIETLFSPEGHFYAESFAGTLGESHFIRHVDVGHPLAQGLDPVGFGIHPEKADVFPSGVFRVKIIACRCAYDKTGEVCLRFQFRRSGTFLGTSGRT